MIKYKIFTKDNYFFIIDVETSREYSSHKADVLISKRYKDFDFYTAHNIPDWNILEALKVGELIKEDDSPYTKLEFETFYQQFTGKSSGGSGGVAGDASAANQVITNTKLTSIDNKTPVLSGGKIPVEATIISSTALSDAQLRATPVPVTVSGGATEATLSALNSKMPNNGQALMANSQPVVIASNQTVIPTNLATVLASGNITTQNLVPAGVATANSTVEIVLNGSIGLSVQVTGTYTGALSLQGTIDGINWITIGGTPILNVSTGAWSANIASATQGIFKTEVVGLVRARVTALAAVTGTATVTITGSQNTSIVGIDAPLPTGANVIGALTANQSVNFAQFAGTAVVNGGVAGVQAIGGNVAHSSATTANPVPTGGRVIPTTIATIDTTLVAGDSAWTPVTTGYQRVVKQNSPSELDYNFIFQTVATTVTPQALVQASGTASIRNYIKSIRVQTDTLGAAGTVYILDGALTVSSIAITTGLVTTSVAHDLKVGDSIIFTALVAGTGVTVNTLYYVTAIGSATTFNFSASIGGANIIPSVAYTGTTMYRILDQIRLQTSAFQPTVINYEEPLRNNPNMAVNFLIPTSLTSGNIYLTVNGYRGF